MRPRTIRTDAGFISFAHREFSKLGEAHLRSVRVSLRRKLRKPNPTHALMLVAADRILLARGKRAKA